MRAMAADASTTDEARAPGAVRRALMRTFGPPPIRADADAGDPGLTGPDSASWQVIGDPSAIAGGVRGLLVQLAHPLAMAGVHDHSAFRTDPLGRLQRTSAYVTTTTFGSTAEALAVTRRVRAVHRRVTGIAPDGRAYTAGEPHLLAWVSIALTSSFLIAYRLWGPGDVLDEDRFVVEQSRIGALLDPRVDLTDLANDAEARTALRNGELALPMLDEGVLPTTAAALMARLAEFRSELGVNRQARDALGFLRHPPLTPGSLVGYRVLLAGAHASLDADLAGALEVRRPAALRGAALDATAVAVAALRRVAGPSPTQLAAHARLRAATGGE